MQWIWDELTQRQPCDVPGARVSRTTRGFRVVPEVQGNSAGKPAEFKVKEVFDDYLRCHTWNGTTEGAFDVFVAKPPRIRCSITQEYKYGTRHTYTYTAGPDAPNKLRLDSDGSSTETQRIVPVWIIDEIIYAVPAVTSVKTAVGATVTMLMVADARKWMGD